MVTTDSTQGASTRPGTRRVEHRRGPAAKAPAASCPAISDAALSLLRELSSLRGKARIGRRSRALASLHAAGLVEYDHSGDPRRPWWPLTAAGRREVERRRKR
jgi:hypothetical protein